MHLERQLLLFCLPVVSRGGPWFIPPRSSSAPERLTPFCRRDIAPSCGAETNGLTFYRRRREFPTRNVQYLQSQVNEDLRRKSGLSHNPPQYSGSSHTQCTGELRRNMRLSRV